MEFRVEATVEAKRGGLSALLLLNISTGGG